MQPLSPKQNEDRLMWLAVAILGFLAVLLGAFGAHALRGRLEAPLMSAFQTGVSYQFYHVFALALCLLLQRVFPAQNFSWAYRFFSAGIVLFSGSLYLYSVTSWRWVAFVTPLGGTCFLIGWIMLAVAVLRRA